MSYVSVHESTIKEELYHICETWRWLYHCLNYKFSTIPTKLKSPGFTKQKYHLLHLLKQILINLCFALQRKKLSYEVAQLVKALSRNIWNIQVMRHWPQCLLYWFFRRSFLILKFISELCRTKSKQQHGTVQVSRSGPYTFVSSGILLSYWIDERSSSFFTSA